MSLSNSEIFPICKKCGMQYCQDEGKFFGKVFFCMTCIFIMIQNGEINLTFNKEQYNPSKRIPNEPFTEKR